MPDSSHRRWLLLIYRLPSDPSSARSAVWRETKRLGALSLQHAVCMLPVSEANRAAYGRLARRIEEYGGEATVLEPGVCLLCGLSVRKDTDAVLE